MMATALKMFSLTPQTRRAYRLLGNTLGQKNRIRIGLEPQYIERVHHLLKVCATYGIPQPGDRLLEIGTGWVHWEATLLALFYDVQVTLFDVWDNRNFASYQHYCHQLDVMLDHDIPLDANPLARAHKLLALIAQAQTFEDVYTLLNFTYIINPHGTLDVFSDQQFAMIFSSNVLEHVDAAILPGFTRDFYRILQPGGYSVQQIDLGDHLTYYDRTMPTKNYLHYNNRTWQFRFANVVQYFNRIQKPVWLDLFRASGLEMVALESVDVDLSQMQIAKSYQQFKREDLRCWTLRVVHQRPD
jgi:predicted SAM-dependent methyltransferase